VQEGVLQPSADQIAERAGLSRRSVFNHFGDLGELYDAVVVVGMQRCVPLLKEVSHEEPLGRRVELLSEARSKFFEATSPFTRALTAQALVGSAGKQARRVSLAALGRQRQDVEQLFRDDLCHLSSVEQSEIIEAISATASPVMWEYLRRSRGHSMLKARSVVKRTLIAILRDAGVDVEE
jgi:AcrR family transcriptional regulator